MSVSRQCPAGRLRLRAMVAVVLLGLGMLMPWRTARAVLLHSGDSMLVSFSFASAPLGPPGFTNTPPDLLAGLLDATYVDGIGAPAVRLTLRDGATVLGSFDLSFAYPFTTFAFGGPASLFNFRSTRIGDFGTLASGLIDGELLITNISEAAFPGLLPAPSFDASVGYLNIGRAVDTNGYVPYDPSATIDGQVLIGSAVPEPATGLLLGAMLVGLAGRRGGWGGRSRS